MEIVSPLAGWIERNEHLERYHNVNRDIIDDLDSDAARELHRVLHAARARGHRPHARPHQHNEPL